MLSSGLRRDRWPRALGPRPNPSIEDGSDIELIASQRAEVYRAAARTRVRLRIAWSAPTPALCWSKPCLDTQTRASRFLTEHGPPAHPLGGVAEA